jgi:hypothetical protein
MAVASWEVNQTGFLDRPRLQGHPSPAKSQTGDSNFKVSKLYGMLPAETEGDAKARTPADKQTFGACLSSGRTRR